MGLEGLGADVECALRTVDRASRSELVLCCGAPTLPRRQ
jgi:hypothetical protein